MAGWKKAIAETGDSSLTIKNVELNSIIRHDIANEDTINVIEAAMRKSGIKFDGSYPDPVTFNRNSEYKEAF